MRPLSVKRSGNASRRETGMSFADELKNHNRPASGMRPDAEAAHLCGRLTEAIKDGCRQASHDGRSAIFGYVFLYTDQGGEKARFVETLPRLREQAGRSGGDPAGKNMEGFTCDPDGYTTKEVRLYEGYIIPGDVKTLQKMESLMSSELQKLGFSDFRVQKVMLPDVYAIIRRRSSVLSGNQVERITTRTAPDPVYTLHFSVSWQ